MTCYLVSAHRFNSISVNQSPPKFQVKICTMVICCSCRNFNHEHHNPIGGERFQILHSLMNFYFISARHSKFSSRKVSVKSLVYFWTVKVVAELIQIGSCLVEVVFSPLHEILESKAMPPCLLIHSWVSCCSPWLFLPHSLWMSIIMWLFLMGQIGIYLFGAVSYISEEYAQRIQCPYQ